MWRIAIFVLGFLVTLAALAYVTNMPSRMDIEPPIVVDVDESLSESPAAQVKISLWTQKIYENHNYELEASVRRRGSQISIDLHHVEVPHWVLPAFGPASMSKTLELENGSYSLALYLGDQKDTYSITVSDREIVTARQETRFSYLAIPYGDPGSREGRGQIVERLPKGILLATCYFNGPSAQDPWDEHCMQLFESLGSKMAPYALVDDPSRTPATQYYRNSLDDAELTALAHRFGRPDYYVALMTSEGMDFFGSGESHHPGRPWRMRVDYQRADDALCIDLPPGPAERCKKAAADARRSEPTR